jgi:indoleamine 2,3-dioxygenase
MHPATPHLWYSPEMIRYHEGMTTPRTAGQVRTITNPETFHVDPQRGFLPATDPLGSLPSAFTPWEEIAHNLPKLLVTDRLRHTFVQLPTLKVAALRDPAQLERAMLLLSYFGHAYVWADEKPADRIPAGIAVPWYAVAQRLGRPPVLSYASYALQNWRRLDATGPVALGNIVLRQNFLAGMDEEWFILVHVDIEAKVAPALVALGPAQTAVVTDQGQELERHLTTIASALERAYATLLRMPERCDPYIYYHRVRPYIHGWKNHPALPQGVTYEGVEAYGGTPQQFRGETGAQSSIIPALDAALGITHEDDPLRLYLMQMRDYMPPAHRAFIEALEQGPSIRQYVIAHQRDQPTLRDAYNACVQWIGRFRSKHLEYAGRYIHQQSQQSPDNPTDVGTGGTPFMPYLKKHRDETMAHLTE